MTLQPETLALHGGSFRADPATGAVVPPIYFTTSFQFRDSEHARRLFYLEELGYTYTRTVNPSREVLERRVTALEGGKAALALATGAAAAANVMLSLTLTGDNVVVAADAAHGRHAGLVTQLRRFGIDVRVAEPAGFAAATDDRTRAWFAESLSVPSLSRFPIARVAAQGRALGVPLVVDNTALPLTSRPLAEGAAAVVYSATEVLGGHGTTNGGLIIDGGDFSWESPRFPTLSAPDPSYHGAVWVEVVKKWGASPLIARARAGLLRDFGATISPMDVFHLIQGVETLPLRVRGHAANAARVATFLEGHAAVSNLAADGALVAFDVADSSRFIEALELFLRTAEYGAARSAAILPAPAPNRVLLSIGLEHPDDIVADLAQALS